MTDPRRLFGARIRNLRRDSGRTQEYLAAKMNVSQNYLSSIERGRENPTFDMLIKLSEALKVEMWELFDFEHEAGPKELREMMTKFTKEADDEKLRLAVKVLRAITR